MGQCNGKYVYHLDNDALVEKGWLSKAVEAAENAGGKAGAVGSKIVGRKYFGKGLQGEEIVRERFAVCGVAMMYSKEALEKVGVLDAALWSPIYGEEQDWCYRARNTGSVERNELEPYVRFFGKKSLKAILEKNGFEVKEFFGTTGGKNLPSKALQAS